MVEAHEEAQKKTNDDENNATFIQIAMMLIVVAENKGETDNNLYRQIRKYVVYRLCTASNCNSTFNVS